MLLDKLVNRNKKGFTLVELMVVVVIIGILVGIAVPIYSGVQRNAANRTHEANIRILRGAALMAISEHGIPGSALLWNADSNGTDPHLRDSYIDEWPIVPDVADGGDPVADPDKLQTYQVRIGDDGEVTITLVQR